MATKRDTSEPAAKRETTVRAVIVKFVSMKPVDVLPAMLAAK